jgi:hypothetical protein
VVDVTAKRGGGRKMTRELRSGGIRGKVRQIPARRPYVGRYMSLVRVPPLPKHSDAIGMGSGAYNGADVVANSYADGPAKHDIALRLSAFNSDPKDRWIVYVGRRTRSGEKPKLVGPEGPETERAAFRSDCEGLLHVLGPSTKRGVVKQADGKRCGSLPRIVVPGR